MPGKQPERRFKVGDRLIVSLSSGRIEEAVVKAVVNDADGVRLQVDFGHDETALLYTWKIREPET